MKLKITFLFLAMIAGLQSWSQGLPFSGMINGANGSVDVNIFYVDSISGISGTMVVQCGPNGGFDGLVPVTGNVMGQMMVWACISNCQGLQVCDNTVWIPGAIMTFELEYCFGGGSVDNDGDGWDQFSDCNDNNQWVYPGAFEECNNGVDNDCDGSIDEGCNGDSTMVDNDNDGFTSDVDCNDANPWAYPGAFEECNNGIDNDCDGLIDEDCGGSSPSAVLFRVDMSMVDSDGDGITGEAGEDFDPANLHIAGNFADPNYDDQVDNPSYANWNPGFISLNALGNGVYGVILQLVSGNYDYKFINGNSWGFEEATSGACFTGGNRTITVSAPNVLTDAVCFGACSTCLMPTNVTFRVNMSNETVSPNGVHIAGSFQNWSPGDMNWAMVDMGNNVYELTKPVPAGSYQYKFVNGNDWSGADNDNESLPAECNVNGNRSIDVTGASMTVEYCYNQCTADCIIDPNPANIIFQVDMASMISIAAFNPTVDTLWMISGATTPQWQPGKTVMTDADGDQVYECVVNIAGPASFQYKYLTGTDIYAPILEEGFGIDSTGCGITNGVGGWNRTFVRSGTNESTPIMCFDQCSNCNENQQISGCTNPQACNYNPSATQDNGSCSVIGSPCNDNNNNTYNDIIDSNCTCLGASQNIGCTNPQACNFNPSANQDNGSCLVIGSTCNDGNNATINDIVGSSCTCAGTPTDLNGNNENTYQGLFYQAVARNADGTPMANQNISIRFSLHQSAATGVIEYQEIQNVNSNALGLFTTYFGTGQASVGTFNNIQWGVNAKYLQVEMDINGWQSIGTQQLAAVPYAIRAKEVDPSGLKLQSPNGNCYILQVNNNGSLSTLQVPCD
jgi:hypothetical protein